MEICCSRDCLKSSSANECCPIEVNVTMPARRNTNLFQGVLRSIESEVPYAENLIHRTEKGHLVRRKKSGLKST